MIDVVDPAELRSSIELFYFAYREFTARPDHMLEKRGLGRVHHRILYFVGRHPQIAISALLELLKVSKQALNMPLRQLVQMGLVSVAIAPHDGRVKQLTLTREGARLESQLTATQTRQLRAAFEDVGAAAAANWTKTMQAILEQT